MTQPVLQAVSVTKCFGSDVVVDHVSLDVAGGETVCILGPSGAGKTTFLRCLNGLEQIDSGAVLLKDEILGYERKDDYLLALPPRAAAFQRRSLGMVFQSFNLFPHLNVKQNVMVAPQKVLRQPRAEVEERAMELLRRVGLEGKADSYPSELSGGQQQRVAIARALAMRPTAVLFDEPTSALDPELVNEVLDVMRDLAESGMTMVVVTHEIGFAREAADTVVFMEKGVIAEQGPAREVIDNPRNERTREFFSKVI